MSLVGTNYIRTATFTTHLCCRFRRPLPLPVVTRTQRRGVPPTLVVVSAPHTFSRPNEPDSKVYYPPSLSFPSPVPSRDHMNLTAGFTTHPCCSLPPTPSRNHTNPTARCTTHPRCLFSPHVFLWLHEPDGEGLHPLAVVSAPYIYPQLHEPDSEVYHPLSPLFPPPMPTCNCKNLTARFTTPPSPSFSPLGCTNPIARCTPHPPVVPAPQTHLRDQRT